MQNRIKELEIRLNILTERNKENSRIVSKLRRKIKNLQAKMEKSKFGWFSNLIDILYIWNPNNTFG